MMRARCLPGSVTIHKRFQHFSVPPCLRVSVVDVRTTISLTNHLGAVEEKGINTYHGGTEQLVAFRRKNRAQSFLDLVPRNFTIFFATFAAFLFELRG